MYHFILLRLENQKKKTAFHAYAVLLQINNGICHQWHPFKTFLFESHFALLHCISSSNWLFVCQCTIDHKCIQCSIHTITNAYRFVCCSDELSPYHENMSIYRSKKKIYIKYKTTILNVQKVFILWQSLLAITNRWINIEHIECIREYIHPYICVRELVRSHFDLPLIHLTWQVNWFS